MSDATYTFESSSCSDDSGTKSGEPKKKKKRDKQAAMARYYAGAGVNTKANN